MSQEKCFSRAVTAEVIVGAFVALVFVALGIFTIVISGGKFLNNRQYPIRIAFDNAMGLRRNDPVIARGTSVGIVNEVYYDRQKVYVEAMLTRPITFREGYAITVQATSILGGRQLVLSEGPPDGAEIRDVDELVGNMPSDVMDDATAAIKSLRDFLDGDFLDNLDAAAKGIADVARRIERGEGTLGKLLSSDETVYNDLRDLVANLREISARLEAGEGTLGKLLSSDETLYNDLRDLVANLKGTSARLEAGEGTLGRLLSSDSELYDNLNGAVLDVRETIDDMREVSPVSTFSSFIFGAF